MITRTSKTHLRSLTSTIIKSTTTISIDPSLGTGSGPFIEVPKFKPLGNPSNLLQIIIPQSSSNLNIRSNSNSIIGIDHEGPLRFKEKFIAGGLEFQELSSAEHNLNLIISGDVNSYKLLELENKDTWTLIKDETLIGWVEKYRLNFRAVDILERLNSLEVSGNGYIILNGVNEVIDLNLGDGEEILINPNALIATTAKNVSYKLIPHGIFDLPKLPKFPKIELPRHGIWGSIFNPINKFVADVKTQTDALWKANEDFIKSNPYVKSTINGVSKIYDYIYSKIFYNSEGAILRRNPIFLKIKGPARLILNNSETINNNQIFTTKEIKNTFM